MVETAGTGKEGEGERPVSGDAQTEGAAIAPCLFNRKLRFLLNKNATQEGALRAKENGCLRSRAPARVCAKRILFCVHTFFTKKLALTY